MNKLSMIVATDINGLIGSDGKLPWHIPWDLKYFKKTTLNSNIIMGRTTYESIGKVLPNRTNIIVTSDQSYAIENAIVVNNIEKAMEHTSTVKETFVIGGRSIYEQFLPFVDRLYLNEIQEQFNGDTYFPNIDDDDWIVDSEDIVEAISGDMITYTIKSKVLRRNNKL